MPPRIAVGAHTAGFDDDFLDVDLVVDENARRQAGHLVIHAVHDRLRLGRAMHAIGGLRAIAQAADAAVAFAPQRDARDDRREGGEPPGPWQRLQRFLRELHLCAGAAKVNGRRLSGDGDRFFECAYGKVGVDRRGELGAQLETFPFRRG